MNTFLFGNGLEVRAVPHFKTDSEGDLIGYAAMLVKTVNGNIPAPEYATGTIQRIFNNNSAPSVLCYVGANGFLTTEPAAFYDSPVRALSAAR